MTWQGSLFSSSGTQLNHFGFVDRQGHQTHGWSEGYCHAFLVTPNPNPPISLKSLPALIIVGLHPRSLMNDFMACSRDGDVRVLRPYSYRCDVDLSIRTSTQRTPHMAEPGQ